MNESAPIIDPEKLSDVVDMYRSYMERIIDLKKSNTPEQYDTIMKMHREWIRGHGLPSQYVDSLSDIQVLMEAKKLDRSNVFKDA